MDRSTKNLMTVTVFQKGISSRVKVKFLGRLGRLLTEGFSISDALSYLSLSMPEEESWIERISSQLNQGHPLNQALADCGFQDWIHSQIYFAQENGQLAPALIQCSDQLKVEEERKKELYSLLAYPSFLLVFMVGMVMAIRFLLLPQMKAMVPEGDHLAQAAVALIYYAPSFLILLVVGTIFFLSYMTYYRKKHSAMAYTKILCRMPFVGRQYISKYYTYRFCQEWGALLKSGLSMQKIVMIMQSGQTSRLMQEVGGHLEEGLLQGQTVSQLISQLSFFDSEFASIVLHGQKIGSLANSLILYAEQLLQDLNEKIQRTFQLIQPLLFIFIAALIVIIYGSMMLPMFSFMESL